MMIIITIKMISQPITLEGHFSYFFFCSLWTFCVRWMIFFFHSLEVLPKIMIKKNTQSEQKHHLPQPISLVCAQFGRKSKSVLVSTSRGGRSYRDTSVFVSLHGRRGAACTAEAECLAWELWAAGDGDEKDARRNKPCSLKGLRDQLFLFRPSSWCVTV